jgi:hypothetical protein
MASGIMAGHFWCDYTVCVSWNIWQSLKLSNSSPTFCSHSLVIEVFIAEVVKEFIYNLVVIYDLCNPLLHVQVRKGLLGPDSPPKTLDTREGRSGAMGHMGYGV